MILPGRSYVGANDYRYGFNGKEKVDEVHGNVGDMYDYGARIYDPRLGKWLSPDPSFKKYPGFAPYTAFGDNPIFFVDPGGETLSVAVNKYVEMAVGDVYSIVPQGAKGAINVTTAGKVEFDMNKVPENLRNDPGVQLLNNMVTAEQHILYEVNTSALVRGRDNKSGIVSNMAIENDLSRKGSGIMNTSETAAQPGEAVTKLPSNEQYQGQVTISPNTEYSDKVTEKPIARAAIVLHEMKENYEMTVKGKHYKEAHEAAIDVTKEINKKDSGDKRGYDTPENPIKVIRK